MGLWSQAVRIFFTMLAQKRVLWGVIGYAAQQ
jgi:hypothetical protein